MENIESVVTTSTHHGYLNTEVVLQSTLPEVHLTDSLTDSVYTVTTEPTTIRLTEGEHKLTSEALAGSIDITIEDAQKYGGGLIKRGYVFDHNPWAFVVTKDRLYASNTETSAELVEHLMTPDEIIPCNLPSEPALDRFVLRSADVYSIYDVRRGVTLIDYSHHLFCNSHYLVYLDDAKESMSSEQSSEELVVFRFDDRREVVRTSGEYSLDEDNMLLYYSREGAYYLLDLRVEDSKPDELEKLGGVKRGDLLCDGVLLRLVEDKPRKKTYHLNVISERRIKKLELELQYYVGSYGGCESALSREMRAWMIDEESFGSITSSFMWMADADISLHLVALDRLMSSLTGYGHVLCGMNICLSRPLSKQSDSTSVLIPGLSDPSLIALRDRAVIEESKSESYIVCRSQLAQPFAHLIDSRNQRYRSRKEQSDLAINHTNGVLGVSESGDKSVSLLDGRFVYKSVSTGSEQILLDNLYDHSSYTSAYFTSDDLGVLMVGEQGDVRKVYLEECRDISYDISGSLVAPLREFNGYLPKVEAPSAKCLKPVWRDPITLRRVEENDAASNYLFRSPDGRYVASTQVRRVYTNLLTEKAISREEFRALCVKYWLPDKSGDEDDKRYKEQCQMVIDARRSLVQQVGSDFFSKDQREKLSQMSPREGDIESKLSKWLEKIVTSGNSFIWLILKLENFVVCVDQQSGEEILVPLLVNETILYLNYVSFSYDHRYLAFGAKIVASGLFGIYNLLERKTVYSSIDDDLLNSSRQKVRAIWMTLFSKQGYMACYDSHPFTFILHPGENDVVLQSISNKSLLCFSPTGKYLALSEQGYIPYISAHKFWGHIPSGRVFVYPADDPDKPLKSYNDLGSGIAGLGRGNTVVSSAFSSDENRLLVVGDDGVVVIRNLHIGSATESLSEKADSLK